MNLDESQDPHCELNFSEILSKVGIFVFLMMISCNVATTSWALKHVRQNVEEMFAIKPTPTCLSRRLSLLSCCSHRKRSQWDSHSRFALLFTFFSRLESGKYLIFFHILPLTRWKKINRFWKVVSVELQCLREREVIDRALQPDSNFLVEFF